MTQLRIGFQPKYKAGLFSEAPTQKSRHPLISMLIYDLPIICQMSATLNVCVKRMYICYIRSVTYTVFSFISPSET